MSDDCPQCTTPGSYSIAIRPAAPCDPCSYDATAAYTVSVTDLHTGKPNYQVTAPTAEECRAMLKAVGIEIAIDGVPGWEPEREPLYNAGVTPPFKVSDLLIE